MPYPTFCIDKRGWCVAIQTKPRCHIDSNEVEEDITYQVDQMSHANEIIQVKGVFGLHAFDGDPEQLEGPTQEDEDEYDNEDGEEEEKEEEEEEEEDDDDENYDD